MAVRVEAIIPIELFRSAEIYFHCMGRVFDAMIEMGPRDMREKQAETIPPEKWADPKLEKRFEEAKPGDIIMDYSDHIMYFYRKLF